MMGAFNFELLQEEGVGTHYRGMLEGEEVKEVSELEKSSNKMALNLAHKPQVEFKQGKYHYENLEARNNFLIPLEVIFRNSIPLGSSFRRRHEPSEAGLNREDWPDEKVDLENQIVEFSTKLEEKDRYIGSEEAQELSSLLNDQFGTLESKAKKINRVVTRRADEKGFTHEDGKVEFIYSKGDVILADVAGTFDENRFSYQGKRISKEFLRQWYKQNDPGWYKEVKEAKKEANEKGDQRLEVALWSRSNSS